MLLFPLFLRPNLSILDRKKHIWATLFANFWQRRNKVAKDFEQVGKKMLVLDKKRDSVQSALERWRRSRVTIGRVATNERWDREILPTQATRRLSSTPSSIIEKILLLTKYKEKKIN
jgi:uncharacterized protein (DUF2342 family)